MRLHNLVVLLMVCLIVTASFSKDKETDWQLGKLTNVEPSWASGYVRCRSWLYSVETETMIYVFSAHSALCSDHPPPFIIGNQVKFMLEPKGKAVLVDEEGKEFKTSLIKKVACTLNRGRQISRELAADK